LFGQILVPRYPVNALSNLDEA